MAVTIVGEISIEQKETISVNSFVAESQQSVQLLPKNPKRISFYLINKSSKDMYVNFEATADNNGIKIKRNGILSVEGITGQINGVWKNGANKGVYIIENSIL